MSAAVQTATKSSPRAANKRTISDSLGVSPSNARKRIASNGRSWNEFGKDFNDGVRNSFGGVPAPGDQSSSRA